jgi:hypothetical protein
MNAVLSVAYISKEGLKGDQFEFWRDHRRPRRPWCCHLFHDLWQRLRQ